MVLIFHLRFAHMKIRIKNLSSTRFFFHYHKQDQLLVAWLLASMSSSILTKMVNLDCSTAIWTHLSTYYASHTRATIKKLRLLLRTPKNNCTVANYFLDIKKTIDSLSTIGASISNTEHIDAILDGLSKEYDGFITEHILPQIRTHC